MTFVASMGLVLLILAVVVAVGMVLTEARLNQPPSLRERVERAEQRVEVPSTMADEPLAAHDLAKAQVAAEAGLQPLDPDYQGQVQAEAHEIAQAAAQAMRGEVDPGPERELAPEADEPDDDPPAPTRRQRVHRPRSARGRFVPHRRPEGDGER